MDLRIFPTRQELGRAAAERAAAAIREGLAARGRSSIVVPAGASQLELLAALVPARGIDWTLVTLFHLDEYIGMPVTHPASFRKFVKERIVERLPAKPAAVHYLDGEGDAAAECRRMGDLIAGQTIDLALVGIGENGHLAFNDPPADFEAEAPYLVVNLDEACRRQQLGEGWFPTLADVPQQAISMSVRQIMKSRVVVCTVPDQRKAKAAAAAIEGPVTPQVPASILQRHPACAMLLDEAAASLMKR